MKISIITCCKNSLPYLPENIKSVQKQDFSDYEHLFICSSSNDGTIQYLKKLKYKKKRILFTKSKGLYKAINLGISKSKGEIIFLLHSDDFITNKDLFKIICKTFNKYRLDFVYGNIKISKKNDTNKILRIWAGTKLINTKSLNYSGISLCQLLQNQNLLESPSAYLTISVAPSISSMVTLAPFMRTPSLTPCAPVFTPDLNKS